MPNATTVGMRLTQLRKERGQTRAFVARRLGFPYSTLLSYEGGARNPPDKAKIKLAEYYGVPVGELFFDDDYHLK